MRDLLVESVIVVDDFHLSLLVLHGDGELQGDG
jgi:hypothetical protein